ncbi:uncharacterized protein LOC134277402 [Saccostrea cucullata]|uniref:uncharacterized protein LOC134277402 n=1 Tax=Saccostrea cuccullata TaxID=36930 RepID=UPI002ED5EE40
MVHTKAYCWNSYNSGIYCELEQICCGIIPNEYCCGDSGGDSPPGFVIAFIVIGVLIFVFCSVLTVIRCLCKKQTLPGTVVGTGAHGVQNQIYPKTVHPHRHIVPPQTAGMRGRAAQGQVFISHPQHSGQPYQQHPQNYSPHGSGLPHTGSPNFQQHQMLQSMQNTTHYPPQRHPLPSTAPPKYEEVIGLHETERPYNVPPEVALLPGHVPPPFEYNPPSLPPRSQLYNNK